jgi:hypothetical protein
LSVDVCAGVLETASGGGGAYILGPLTARKSGVSSPWCRVGGLGEEERKKKEGWWRGVVRTLGQALCQGQRKKQPSKNKPSGNVYPLQKKFPMPTMLRGDS